VGFCIYTLEFDTIPLAEQLKAIWDGGIGRTDDILRCFRDYRGYEVMYGGRKSLHFHFIFDLRHWNHDLAFANNSSYQENWLADFPDRYLREAHRDRWAMVRSAFRLGTRIEAEPDESLQNWEQNRRVPLALRLVQPDHPLGIPAGVYVPQYVLASGVRKNIPREAKGWFHDSNLIGPSAIRYAQRQGKRKQLQDRCLEPAIATGDFTIDEQRRFDRFLVDNFPKLGVGTDLRYASVEFGSQGPKVYLHNNRHDETPSSVIQGDYKSILLQGGHDFDRTTYPLAVSPNRLFATMVEQGELYVDQRRAASSRDASITSEVDELMQKFEAEVHDCDSYRQFLSEHIVTAMSTALLVLILGPEGCGKSSAVMANIGRMIECPAEPFSINAGYEPVFISSPSYEQAAEKIGQFSAMHSTSPYVAYEYLSLTELYQRHCPKDDQISEIDALEMGCPSWLGAIYERQPRVYAKMRAHRDELYAIRDRGQIPVLFGVHETVRRHADTGMTRLFYAQDFNERWFEPMTPDQRRAYRSQLRFQTIFAHVVFDEVSPSDLVSIHRAPEVHWAWAFEQSVEQIPRQDKLTRYREFKKFRVAHPRPRNDDDWFGEKSDGRFYKKFCTRTIQTRIWYR
jgi:hypothetical protein